MGQAILLSENRKQWDKLVKWQASMTVKRSRPLKIELPARVLVCVEGQIVGEMLATHFLKTYNPGVFCQRAKIPVAELEAYAAEGPVFGWVIADVVNYEEPEQLCRIGVEQEPVSWVLVDVEEAWPG